MNFQKMELILNGNIENYRSPFYEERKLEYDSMYIANLLKKIWMVTIENNNDDFMRIVEMTIQEYLFENYDVINLSFNRSEKKIRFEIDCEEIEL